MAGSQTSKGSSSRSRKRRIHERSSSPTEIRAGSASRTPSDRIVSYDARQGDARRGIQSTGRPTYSSSRATLPSLASAFALDRNDYRDSDAPASEAGALNSSTSAQDINSDVQSINEPRTPTMKPQSGTAASLQADNTDEWLKNLPMDIPNLYITPEKQSDSRSVQQRRLAIELAPAGDRCLLTNVSGKCIHGCHLVANSHYKIEKKQNYPLSKAWGDDFDINSRWNMFFLRADIHILYDGFEWMLIPKPDTLKRIVEVSGQRGKPGAISITEEFAPRKQRRTYEYYFLPHPKMRAPIDRYHVTTETVPSTSEGGQETRDCYEHRQCFTFPYSDIPPIESHVPPHLVIFDAMRKFIHIDNLKEQAALYELLQSILDSYHGHEDGIPDAAKYLDTMRRLFLHDWKLQVFLKKKKGEGKA
ncbi:hypothetical protein CONPUDRAFT_139484 [Coniophora puteana RWD-64-598 SS2]|uniref:HNH nuclease domain-containing protein n=1 Tax=Coniophora puteana (strain RWD-64-598) TaxID=741705 RepID=A0A5M3MC70_CONPW|nr:uncharacterized protein CONPUDRAFT_139484 [Coniophora puteana RWD-64-598 SS2]EIW76842.1 hypothetical protein CONPUDRAFT_139484 [Coniophora puteana RWD-64-598 SS2]